MKKNLFKTILTAGIAAVLTLTSCGHAVNNDPVVSTSEDTKTVELVEHKTITLTEEQNSFCSITPTHDGWYYVLQFNMYSTFRCDILYVDADNNTHIIRNSAAHENPCAMNFYYGDKYPEDVEKFIVLVNAESTPDITWRMEFSAARNIDF